ncbi:MAG: phosphate ABC transporter permease subunit PstC [Deltaproteobacteria bacterium]|nr:phosphate ABC transporter permease subunit PstC [Deltaproteobacteria bacterium]
MAAAAPPNASALDLKVPRALHERVIGRVFQLFAWVSVLTAAGIVLVLFGQSLAFFAEVGLGAFFGDTTWSPMFADAHFGIWPLVVGTLLTTLIAMIVALPLGLLAAVYLAELAPERLRAWLKPALEILAGIPTVVYGYFALNLVTPGLQAVIPGVAGSNALAAGIVMGLMILPIVTSLAEDAIYAVPQSLREGAYALGASRTRTIFRVVLPSASSGIVAAVILAVSRAVGETMIVAIAAGMEPRLTADPREPVQTMTAYIVQVSFSERPSGSLEMQAIFAVGLMLFLSTLVFNAIAQRLRQKILRGGHT